MSETRQQSIRPARPGPCWLRLAALLIAAGPWSVSGAATSLSNLSYSADATISPGGVQLTDETVLQDNLSGSITPVNLGSLAPARAVDAYGPAGGGTHYFSLDAPVTLGGVQVRPHDIVSFNGSSHALVVDMSAQGVPRGTNLSALSVAGGTIYCSFDAPVLLDGVLFQPGDIAAYNVSGSMFSMGLDASVAGVPDGLVADAVERLGNNNWLLSYSDDAMVGGVNVGAEDVIEYDGSSFSMAYDASGNDADWHAANLDAVAATQQSAGEFQFSTASQSVNEGVGTVTVTVNRVNSTSGAVSVDYATADNTAVAGSDYTAASGTLNWADGDGSSKQFSISITDDTSAESAEDFNANLSNPGGGASLGSPATQTITINANDQPAGELVFSSATQTVGEGAGTATVTVDRVNGTNGTVSVDYATSDNTATAGSDYTAASGTLNWSDGDGTSKQFTVSITDDTTDESNETFDANLSNAGGGASIGSPSTQTVTIADNDTTVTYTGGNAGGPLFNRPDGIVASCSAGSEVRYHIQAFTLPTAGSYDIESSQDYDGHLALYQGGFDPAAPCTNLIGINDDAGNAMSSELPNQSLATGTDYFLVTSAFNTGLTGTFTNTITGPGGANLRSPGDLAFSTASQAVGEGAGTVTVTVERNGGSYGAVSISYATSDNTATAGSDYTAASGTLSWSDGETADQTFTVSIADDAIAEGAEDFNVALSNATNGASLGSPSTQTITINASDQPAGEFVFSAATQSVNEGAGTVTVSVDRVNGSSGAVSVDYATSDNTATAGSDYTAASGTLNWSDGDSSSKQFSVSITDDTAAEGAEDFDVDLSNPAGGASLGSPATQTVTINASDQPAGEFVFSAATQSVNEGAGTVTVTVDRVNGSSGAVSVDYATSDNSATAGSDYTAASGTLNWSDGDSSSKQFSVSVTDDTAAESAEDFDVDLSNPAGGASLGSPSTQAVTINDNETGVNYSAGNAGAPLFNRPDGTVASCSAGSEVRFHVQPFTVPSSGSYDIESTQDYDGHLALYEAAFDPTTACGDVIAINDDGSGGVGSSEILNVSLSAGTDYFVVTSAFDTGDTGTFTNTITGPAQATLRNAGTLAFSSASQSVGEGTSLTVVVERTGGSYGAVEVDYTTNDASATAGSDYTMAAGSLSWNDGDTADKQFTVPITDDMLAEGNESFDIELSSSTNGATLGMARTQSATITDNDQQMVQWTETSRCVAETAASFQLTVERVNGSSGDVDVSFSINPLSADQPADFSVDTASPVTLSDGQASALVDVTLVDDTDFEGDEAFELQLDSATGNAAIGSPAVVRVGIDENEQPANVLFRDSFEGCLGL